MMKISLIRLLCLCMSSSTVVAFAPGGKPTGMKVSSTELDAMKKGIKFDKLCNIFATSALSFSLLFGPGPALADGQTNKFKLPPIDISDKNRCQFTSSAMGQANAQRDKMYDLRQCNLSGSDATGFDLSGVIMKGTDVSNVKFVEAQFSKGYLQDSTFDGADFTNAIVDRANFAGSSLKGVIFQNTVLTGTSFVGADVENADFTDSYIGDFDIRNLCKNPTLKGENPVTGADTRLSAGCV
mmetsp:Transcript_25343/g.29347  ORF Transcript_25343/g.29347 Transcript_25343/m.29347 type:complete len:240 (+) Transcript_25343:160-879(+)